MVRVAKVMMATPEIDIGQGGRGIHQKRCATEKCANNEP